MYIIVICPEASSEALPGGEGPGIFHGTRDSAIAQASRPRSGGSPERRPELFDNRSTFAGGTEAGRSLRHLFSGSCSHVPNRGVGARGRSALGGCLFVSLLSQRQYRAGCRQIRQGISPQPLRGFSGRKLRGSLLPRTCRITLQPVRPPPPDEFFRTSIDHRPSSTQLLCDSLIALTQLPFSGKLLLAHNG
jgi:hypothetical protein